MRHLLLAFLFLETMSTLAAAEPPYARVLLPAYSEQLIPGGFGSLWKVSFSVYNGSGHEFVIYTCRPPGCLADLWADEALEPNETQTALPTRYVDPVNPVAGAVIYLGWSPGQTSSDANAVAVQLRIADVSRAATNAGTELPVVRESALRTSTLSLLQIPVDARFRASLRVFELDLDRAEFAIRVIDQSTGALITEYRATTTTPAQGTFPRYTPGFAEIADITRGIADAGPGQLRIEIEPLTARSKFWAYVSITNNETQHVTLVTPQ